MNRSVNFNFVSLQSVLEITWKGLWLTVGYRIAVKLLSYVDFL